MSPAFAEDVVGADVAVFVFLGQPRVVEAPLLLQVQQRPGFLFVEIVYFAQVAREDIAGFVERMRGEGKGIDVRLLLILGSSLA